jgi:hypothetical protein
MVNVKDCMVRMNTSLTRISLLFLFSLLWSCSDQGQQAAAPRLTAQGFVISEPQAGVTGQFAPLRLRIESSARINSLRIQERSYDVDLVTTPERDHYALFGLDKRVQLQQDITLNFQTYINRKLTEVGDYQFDIEVTDKKGRSSKALLQISVQPDPAITPPIETGEFKLLREGKGDVKQAAPFGVTWKTIDATRVTIQIRKVENGASKLARFDYSDYSGLTNKPQLAARMQAAEGVEVIEFPTAFDDAHHEVFGIENQGNYYLLCVCKSKTDLSNIGTTVYLTGEYKY